MKSDDANDLMSAIEHWFLSRTLVKGKSIFPEKKPTEDTSALATVRLQTSEFLPEGVDYFTLPNSNRVIVTPAFLSAIKEYIDAFADAEELETVA